ncbi:DUF1573 domain-containing protein [Pontiella sp.]|uniref:DUF1573 domain-containing protein n=1 Tax=Pontiella sp. TaxID=2837462 RepID=UPI00356763EE
MAKNSPVLALCSLVAIAAVAGPKLQCEAPKFDFGAVIGRESISHEFVLTNTGDEPVVVSKIKNCCGVESTLTPMTIPPGSNAVCKSVFNTKNRYGPQDKQILLATNLRRKPYFELKMTGTLLRPVDCTPRFVRLGDLAVGGEIEQTIVATNLLEQAVVLRSVKSTVPGIEAEIVGVTDGYGQNDSVRTGNVLATKRRKGHKDRAGEVQQNNFGQNDSVRTGLGTTKNTKYTKENSPVVNGLVEKEDADRISAPRRSWTVRLRATDALKAGKLSGRVLLDFSTGTVTVPVMGSVKPGIQVVPERIQLSGQSTGLVERLVMLRSEQPFDVLSAKVENAEGTATAEKVAEGKWKIKLTLAPGDVGSNALLRVGTSCRLQPDVVVSLLSN